MGRMILRQVPGQRFAIGVAVAATGLALVVPAPAASAAPAARVALQVTPVPGLPEGASLNGVATAGDGQAWLVGEAPGTGPDAHRTGVIERWDGDRWRAEATPALPPINDLPVTDSGLTSVAVGRDGEVFAAGWQTASSHRRPLALHRTTAGWQVMPFPTDDLSRLASYQFTEVAAWDARHVWFVGNQQYHKVHGIAAYWDGAAWSRPEYPVDYKMDWPTGLVATGPADAWLAGSNWLPANGRGGHVARWNGTAWVLVELPPTGTTPTGLLQSVDGVAATGRDVWIWGVADEVQVILRRDGDAWVPGPPPPERPAGLRIDRLDLAGRGHALATGTYPSDTTAEARSVAAVLARDGHRWAEPPLPGTVTAAHTVRTAVAAGRPGRPGWVVIDTVPTADATAPVTATVLRIR